MTVILKSVIKGRVIIPSACRLCVKAPFLPLIKLLENFLFFKISLIENLIQPKSNRIIKLFAIFLVFQVRVCATLFYLLSENLGADFRERKG
jgi:hypothetical protein